MSENLTTKWAKTAHDQLVGRKIVAVRYMGDDEAKEFGWYQRPIVIQLDDGNLIYPSADDEGNNGGALFTSNEADPVLPTLPIYLTR
jgi:hypothetical protein